MSNFDPGLVQDAARACREAALTFRDIHDSANPGATAAAMRWGEALDGWREALRLGELEVRDPSFKRARDLLTIAERERRRVLNGSDFASRPGLRIDPARLDSQYPMLRNDGMWHARIPVWRYARYDFEPADVDDQHPVVQEYLRETTALFETAKADRKTLGLSANAAGADAVRVIVEKLDQIADDLDSVAERTTVRRGPASHYKDAFDANDRPKPVTWTVLLRLALNPSATVGEIARAHGDHGCDDKTVRLCLADLRNYGWIREGPGGGRQSLSGEAREALERHRRGDT